MARNLLKAAAERHATNEGATETSIEGLRLFRTSRPVDRMPAVYTPCIYCIVQGSKRAHLAGRVHVYDPGHYLVSTVPLPAEADVPRASLNEPVLSVSVSLETGVATETIREFDERVEPVRKVTVEVVPGLGVASADDTFVRAMQRLVELLDDPVAAELLGPGRMREVIFSALRGEAGPLLRRNLTYDREIARSLSYIRENLRGPLSVEVLAKRAGMSRAVFHRRFKATTTYTPIQFIKALRLRDGAMLIASGVSVKRASARVGYTSVSQFVREFRRQYGEPPKQWSRSVATHAVSG